MSRRLPVHPFRQALRAGLPVRRRAPAVEDTDAPAFVVWVFTYNAEGDCLSRAVLPASEAKVLRGEVFTFSGRTRDPDTGLQYHRGRCYDPSPARWVSEGPVGFLADDANLYPYAATGMTPSPQDVRERRPAPPSAILPAG